VVLAAVPSHLLFCRSIPVPARVLSSKVPHPGSVVRGEHPASGLVTPPHRPLLQRKVPHEASISIMPHRHLKLPRIRVQPPSDRHTYPLSNTDVNAASSGAANPALKDGACAAEDRGHYAQPGCV